MRVAEPANFRIAVSSPTARILEPSSATAWAVGCAGFSVQTFPLTRIKLASVAAALVLLPVSNILLGCGSFHPNSNSSPNIAEFCNKGIQAKMDQAGQMGITDPAGANNLWATVDKEVVDQAPWVAMFNPKYIDVLSNRVTGYQFSPQWYFLLDQASVVK